MKYTRREFIRTAGGFVCASTLASQFPGLVEAAEKQRFNILFLMTDQHHHSVLGCAGNPLVKTPNLDRLAGQGARFTNAVCATPFCSPTRASLLTG
ncbi:MAG: sulfatase-like hydrolase/transferase, partial [Armatimonadetes bacterium]|nr:sulfatase-like hydrolase/transferase [Armatimonadota bacterium]